MLMMLIVEVTMRMVHDLMNVSLLVASRDAQETQPVNYLDHTHPFGFLYEVGNT